MEEAIDIARACGVHVEIVHLKCSGVDNWGKAPQILDKIDAARMEGCDIDCDAYPYAAGANPLKNLLPPWVQIGNNGDDAGAACVAGDPSANQGRGGRSWAQQLGPDSVLGGGADLDLARLPETAGQTVAALATARGCDPIDQICDHLIADSGATRVPVASISEDDIREIVRSPTALVGSDGNCVATYGIVSQGMPHPRFYGTFPRIIGRYVRDERLISSSSGLQDDRRPGEGAQVARPRPIEGGLPRRHRYLRSGRFSGRGDLREPASLPERRADIRIVNGTIVIEDATHTGNAGIVLRRGTDGSVG